MSLSMKDTACTMNEQAISDLFLRSMEVMSTHTLDIDLQSYGSVDATCPSSPVAVSFSST